MRRSLFTRYFTVFILITFISFSILALVIGSNMTAITLETKRDDVASTAKSVAGMLSDIYHPTDPESFNAIIGADGSGISMYVEHLSAVTGELRVFLFSADGKLLTSVQEYDSGTFKTTVLSESVLAELTANGTFSGYDSMGGVPAIAEVKHSITHNRGCFGACNFCAIAFHQGREVRSRSEESVIAEAKKIAAMDDFKGRKK